MGKGFIIAIDGPGAAGKGTMAKAISHRLGAVFLTTGMFYRAVAYYCLVEHLDLAQESAVKAVLPQIHIQVNGDTTLLNGVDVTARLHEKDVDKSVPVVANYVSVRAFCIPLQQEIGNLQVCKGKIVVAEGRDIATKVFPDATVKIYLTANPSVRAKRRMEQFKNLGQDRVFEEVYKDTMQRDDHDMHGELQYLVSEPEKYGYTIVDDSDLTEEQTLNKILDVVRQKEHI